MNEPLRHRRWTHAGRLVAALGVVVVIVTGEPASVGADPLVEGNRAKVAVAPNSFRIFGPVSDRDFDYSVAAAGRRAVTRYLARHDGTFELVSPRDRRDELRSQPLYGDTLSVAREWAELGTESYKHLRIDQAIEQLEKAVDRYDKIGYAEVAPKRLAEVLMYLGLSYLNRGDNAARPLEVIKRMIRLDPSRVLRRGFYPDRVANFYKTARQDFVRRLREQGPNRERARELAESTGADLVLYGATFQTEDGRYRMKLYVYSRADESFVEPESVVFEGPSDENVRRAASRAVARIAPCVYEPTDTGSGESVVGSAGGGPFSMGLTFTYASFLEYPDVIQKPFGNAGVGMGARLALTDEFGLGITLNLLSSFQDYSGRILDNFSTFRVFAGPDLGFELGPFNIGISARLEVARIGGFRFCTTNNLAPELGGCSKSNEITYDSLDVGFNSRPRIRVQLFDTFELIAAGSFSAYLLPVSRPSDPRRLNNPLAGEFGIRYEF